MIKHLSHKQKHAASKADEHIETSYMALFSEFFWLHYRLFTSW